MKLFWYWWAFFCVNLLGYGIIYHYDGFSWMAANDFTKIGVALCVVYPIASLMIGRLVYRAYSTQTLPDLDNYWFFSEICLGLGMIGTIVGLLVVFSHGFHDLNFQDQNSVKDLIKNLGLGTSTALISTLVGLVASLLVKIQLRFVENAAV